MSITLSCLAGVNGFFVIAPLSESITLECAFPEGTTDVEWLNGSTPVLVATGRNNTVVMSLTVTERVHGQTYVCRGRDGHGRQLEQRYVALAQGMHRTSVLVEKIKSYQSFSHHLPHYQKPQNLKQKFIAVALVTNREQITQQ